MDAVSALDIIAGTNQRDDESYWLALLSKAKIMAVRDDQFPLAVAVSLFNKDYADLFFRGHGVAVEITGAGIAAHQLRGAYER